MEKIAIKCETNAELKAVLKHYKEKNWSNWNDLPVDRIINSWDAPTIISYEDKFKSQGKSFNLFASGWHVMPFPAFSQLTGVIAEPEEVVIEFLNGTTITVRKDSLIFETGNPFCLSGSQLEEIYTAFKSLN